MSFKQWLLRMMPDAGPDAARLEQRLADMERRLQALSRPECGHDQQPAAPAVVIEQLHIEKLVVEKLEHSNNFGALGIKELGGKLNIGLNCAGPIPSGVLDDYMPAGRKTPPPAQAAVPKQEREGEPARCGPVCNIKARGA